MNILPKLKDAETREALDKLREICMAIPSTTEKLSHGEPTWWANGKRVFASFADHHHDSKLAVWMAQPEGVQGMLIASDPARFFAPPYVGVKGWIAMILSDDVNWDEVADLIEEAHKTIVSKMTAKKVRKP